MSVLTLEESTLCFTLVQKVKDFFQDEEHRRAFETWYREKYGKEYDWRMKSENSK